MAKKKKDKSSKMRYYAIYLPVKHRGVYYDRWVNVQSKAESPGAIHHAFNDRDSAEYFVLHGHAPNVQKDQCQPYESKKKKPTAQQQLLLQQQQYPPTISFLVPSRRFAQSVKQEEEENESYLHGRSESEQSFDLYYAVAKGRKLGIYDDWDEAKKQIDKFCGSEYAKFPDRKSAARYLRMNGIPDDEIRLFRKTFRQQPNFTPNPTSSFKEEFKRFASSQQLPESVARRARVDAIRDEIIRHFLPEGVRISAEQDDDQGYVNLDDDQTLKIFQAMCHKSGKKIYSTIDESLLELKKRPFVNIMDFVDTFRTGKGVRTFKNWNEFKKYTYAGRTIEMQLAKNNEFLAPLLQDLSRGPNAVDPRKVRQKLIVAREAGRHGHSPKQEEVAPDMFALDRYRSLSPSVFDPVSRSYRSPTPDSDQHEQYIKPETSGLASWTLASSRSSPMIDLTQDEDTNYMVTIKPEPSTAVSFSSPILRSIPSPYPADFLDPRHEQNIKSESSGISPFMLPSSNFDNIIDLTQEEETSHTFTIKAEPCRTPVPLRKRTREPSSMVMVPTEKKRIAEPIDCTLYPKPALTQKDIRDFFPTS
jgi:hypothetical protein